MSEDNHFHTTSIYARGLIDKSRKKVQKCFRGTQTAWNKIIKPGLKIASPNISEAVAAETKNPQSAQIRSKILKSLPGGKILSLTNVHGHGLRLKVMCFHFKETFLNKWVIVLKTYMITI